MEALLSNPLFIIVVLVVLFLMAALRITREYERAVVFLLGRFWKVKGPGLIVIIPGIQQMVRTTLRTVVMDIPSQEIITQDNVSASVNAVLYYRILNAQKAIIQVEDYHSATRELGQTTLRSVLGKHDLDDLLAKRDALNADIQDILDTQTDAWGIKVSNVEIKHVEIPESMVRAIARQAEAERERRAKVIHAEGELQAAEKLVQTAAQMEEHPGALQLRYLQTLTDVATENNSTTLFPIPMDLLKPFYQGPSGGQKGGNPA